MALRQSLLLSLAALAHRGAAEVTDGRNGNGLIGITMQMYQPACAFACRDVASGSSLACTPMDDDMGMDGMDMMMSMGSTDPSCYATDDSFLQTLAYCMYQRCDDISNSTLETFWQANVAGREKVQPNPKETYAQALAKITTPPTETLVYGDPLNKTMLIGDDDYQQNWNGDQGFERNEDLNSKYSLVIFLSGVLIPMLFSLLRFVPWPAAMVTKFNAYIIDPPAFGSKHRTPIANAAHIPTRGQALFIFYLVALNIILCAVGYQSFQPSAWYATTSLEIQEYVADRCGTVAMANMALMILYAGRNNLLIWLTNWSHSTFILLHKWVAWIATLQAVIHSASYLQEYVANGNHATESKLAYWIWGAAATVIMSVLLPTSIYPIRKAFYEAFLAWHVVLATFAVVGTYYHIVDRFQHQWGYEVWMYIAVAFWALDHLIRWVRLAMNGVKKATVTVIDADYIRVDIPGIKGDGHAYLWFPTLTWRVWENHPFSVASTDLRRSNVTKQSITLDEEKGAVQRADSDSNVSGSEKRGSSAKGTTFFVRVRGGLTRKLANAGTIPVFVEGAYGRHEKITDSSNLVCIAGGVGITAILPYLHKTTSAHTKLYWGTRTSGLVEALDDELSGVDKQTFVGQRMNIVSVLQREVEAAKAEGKEVVVVCSGPPAMADETRVAVCEIGKKVTGARIRLVEEAFSW